MMEVGTNRIVYGQLQIGKNAVGNVRCEVYLNPLDTSQLTAGLYTLDESLSSTSIFNGIGEECWVRSFNEHETIEFNGVLASAQSDGSSDKVGKIRIDRFCNKQVVKSCPIVEASFVFFLTPIQMFERTRMITTHDMKGLLFGWRGWDKKAPEQWRDEAFEYETSVGKLIFYPGLVFSDKIKGVFEVREQTKALLRFSGTNLDLEEASMQAEGILKPYLWVASFLEKRFLDWHYCTIVARGEEGKGTVVEKYQSRRTFAYRTSQHIQINKMKYRNLLKHVVDKYLGLGNGVREEVDKAIRQLLVGNRPDQLVENKLIYVHSTLDILIKIIASFRTRDWRYKSFRKKLVLACEDAEIEWADLYPGLTRERIFSDEKADFLITKFRNAMIHEGKYPDKKEYDQVFEENARAEALAERMVMKILGIDYENTPIGKFHLF